MAEREDANKVDRDATADSTAASGVTEDSAGSMAILPIIESPSLSPAEVSSKPMLDAAVGVSPQSKRSEPLPRLMPHGFGANDKLSLFKFTLENILSFAAFHKRNALLMVSIAIAAAFGGAMGIWVVGGFDRSESLAIASLNERTLKNSIAHLTEEIDALKTGLEASNKATYRQLTRLGEGGKRESADITGSIGASAVSVPTPLLAPPIPLPRPNHLATENRLVKPILVSDWSIRDIAGGYVYVESRDGNIFQATPGVPLPGLGAVEQIDRRKGRWVVVTSKGLIVSARDRRFFESF